MELAKRGDAGILTARAARTLRVGADCVQASIAFVHSAPTPSCAEAKKAVVSRDLSRALLNSPQ
jgi:hypothetical protein